ncbi:MAG: ArnT family glycosyltransferase, partial [Chthoniobacterales bacterium]
MTLLPKLRRIDPFLALSLGCALLFSVHGSNWGRVECWNPDQTALRRLHRFRPSAGYTKPPFHTYVARVLVVTPANRLRRLAKLITGRAPRVDQLKFIGARALTIALFIGTVALAFSVARVSFGLVAARLIALLLGTSAGFAVYNHFLTCDSPLLFWMMLSLFFARRIVDAPTTANYLFAAITAGLAGATKYNGIAVAIALPAAHLLARGRDRLLSGRFIMALAMVPIGFVIGCPGAVLEWRRFSTD